MNHANADEKVAIIVPSDIHRWCNLVLKMIEGMVLIDSRTLDEVSPDGNVHEEFIKGGIVRAAKKLARYWAKTLIGLCIGGVIAWRAVLKGMNECCAAILVELK